MSACSLVMAASNCWWRITDGFALIASRAAKVGPESFPTVTSKYLLGITRMRLGLAGFFRGVGLGTVLVVFRVDVPDL